MFIFTYPQLGLYKLHRQVEAMQWHTKTPFYLVNSNRAAQHQQSVPVQWQKSEGPYNLVACNNWRSDPTDTLTVTERDHLKA